jgi:hypothetical protein
VAGTGVGSGGKERCHQGSGKAKPGPTYVVSDKAGQTRDMREPGGSHNVTSRVTSVKPCGRVEPRAQHHPLSKIMSMVSGETHDY